MAFEKVYYDNLKDAARILCKKLASDFYAEFPDEADYKWKKQWAHFEDNEMLVYLVKANQLIIKHKDEYDRVFRDQCIFSKEDMQFVYENIPYHALARTDMWEDVKEYLTNGRKPYYAVLDLSRYK